VVAQILPPEVWAGKVPGSVPKAVVASASGEKELVYSFKTAPFVAS